MGLRAGDLNDLILDTFEVDNFQSKMGDDRDVCVVSLQQNKELQQEI